MGIGMRRFRAVAVGLVVLSCISGCALYGEEETSALVVTNGCTTEVAFTLGAGYDPTDGKHGDLEPLTVVRPGESYRTGSIEPVSAYYVAIQAKSERVHVERIPTDGTDGTAEFTIGGENCSP